MKLVATCMIGAMLLTAVEAAVAQDFGFGLKAGVNLSKLKLDDPDASYESRTGFHAGIFLRGRFQHIGIQPEVLLFTQRGEADFPAFGTVEESFTYLSVPMIFKFYPIGGLNLQLGPQFGFLLDGEQRFKNAVIPLTRDIRDAYKSTDISVSAGAGYDFAFGLGLDVRYNIGVSDINDAVDGEPARSRIFLLSIGWNFIK